MIDDVETPRAIWLKRKENGERDIVRGIAHIVMSIPILVVGSFLAYAFGGSYSILIALIMLALTIAAIGRGTGRIISGARNKRRAAQELRSLERGQLPEARVIERS